MKLIRQATSALQEEELEPEVVIYDFKRPHRFSKERVRALQRIMSSLPGAFRHDFCKAPHPGGTECGFH